MPCRWPSGKLAEGEAGTARRDKRRDQRNPRRRCEKKREASRNECIASRPELNWQRANKQRIDRREKIQGDRRLVQVWTNVSGEAESHHMRDVVEIMGKGGGGTSFFLESCDYSSRQEFWVFSCLRRESSVNSLRSWTRLRSDRGSKVGGVRFCRGSVSRRRQKHTSGGLQRERQGKGEVTKAKD